MLKYIYYLIFILFCSTPCLAQNDTLPVSYEDKQPSTGNAKVDSQELSLNTHTHLDLFNIKSNYDVTFPDYWDNYVNQPSISYTYKYEGLHGIIYKQVMRGVERFYDKALKNFWEQSYLSSMDRHKLMSRYGLESSDAGKRWWEEREYFFDHYPIEKGGHHFEQITIGNQYDVVTIGDLSFTNEGRFSWSGWRFSIDAERELPNRKIKGPDYELEPRTQPKQYGLEIHAPRGNIFSGDNWTISNSLNLSVNVTDFSRNKSAITANVTIMGFSGVKKIPWLGVRIRGRARPFNNDYAVEVFFALLLF